MTSLHCIACVLEAYRDNKDWTDAMRKGHAPRAVVFQGDTMCQRHFVWNLEAAAQQMEAMKQQQLPKDEEE